MTFSGNSIAPIEDVEEVDLDAIDTEENNAKQSWQ